MLKFVNFLNNLILLAICFSLNFLNSQDQNQVLDLSLSNKKVVFLTGAAGFIGSNFLKYMFDKYPDYHFLILDALTYAGNLENIPKYIRESNRFEFYHASINNLYIVDHLMSRSDFVVHFAAETHVTRSIFDDTVFFETDVLGTRVMMSTLVKHAKKVERYIHISTSEVCGTAKTIPMDEEHPINPHSPYAAAKAGADRLVYAYWCTYEIPAIIIRPFNNYGPQQHTEKAIPRFITSALKGEHLKIHGAGSQKRDWIHTYDLAKALDLALHLPDFSKIKNQVIHIGSGKGVSILDIAKMILNYLNLSETEFLKFIDDRPGQVDCHISSTQKAQNLLGWKSEISLEEGLKTTIEWYKNNRKRWKRMEFSKDISLPSCNLNAIKRNVEQFDLNDYLKNNIQTLSGGYKQKVILANCYDCD